MDARQFYDYAVCPAIDAVALPNSSAAEQLVMGTVAQESEFVAIHQYGGGPAVGICQMEPVTLNSLAEWLASKQPDLMARVSRLAIPGMSWVDQLPGNLYLSVALCRADYWRVPYALPALNDLEAQWLYYKQYYNSYQGAATREQYAGNWNRLVQPHFPSWPKFTT